MTSTTSKPPGSIHRRVCLDAVGTIGCRRRTGFTLVELIAVMVILAIVAATAAPSLNSIGEVRASAAARQIERDLIFMRQRAVATGTMCWAEFDATNQQWSLLEDVPGFTRTNAAAMNDPMTGNAYVQRLGISPFQDVQLVSANFDSFFDIGFDWLGRPYDAEHKGGGTYQATPLTTQGLITLTGNRQITIEPETGAIGISLP